MSPGPDFRNFFPDGETHSAVQHKAELFSLMGVEGVGGAELELGPLSCRASLPAPLVGTSPQWQSRATIRNQFPRNFPCIEGFEGKSTLSVLSA